MSIQRNARSAKPASSATRPSAFRKVWPIRPCPMCPEWSQGELLKYERELTGFYISAHPLARYEAAIQLFSTRRACRWPMCRTVAK